MIIDLSDRALLKVSGLDAGIFLHKQLSNDIANIADKEIQLNAYCNHKGRIISLFRVFKIADDYYLDFPNDLLDIVQKRLQMFILNSAVVITNISDEFTLLGFLDEKPNVNEGICIKYFAKHYLLLIRVDKAVKIKTSSLERWNFANINLGLPEIFLATTEVFVPQMLNLDIDEIGVNFSKGCYPGQEIVARLHYLGKPKRRMNRFKLNSYAKIGAKLTSAASTSIQDSGRVVLSANIDDNTYCLATIEQSVLNDKIYLDDNILEIIND